MPNEKTLEISGLCKSFGQTKALRGVDFTLRQGEVHALVGENGAGKSTMIRILSGDHRHDAGQILLEEEAVSFRTPHDAVSAGIGFVHQIPAFVPGLSVTENYFLGSEFRKRRGVIDWSGSHKECRVALAALGLEITSPAVVRIEDLNAHERQIVAIARALKCKPKVLILDEVTASLSEPEVRRLLSEVRRLRDTGTAIVYVSHRLEEIFRVADRVTVFRDGRHIICLNVPETTQTDLARHIIGQDAPDLFAPKRTSQRQLDGDILLDVVALEDGVLSPATFSVARKEIVGIAGLGSSGRSRLLKLLYGALPATGGHIHLAGERLELKSTREALAAGIGFVTEDRNFDGFVQTMPVGQNITLPWLDRFQNLGVLHVGAEREKARMQARMLDVKTPSMQADMSSLSGGNQQKAIFSRWVATNFKVLLLDEPTHGVDIGSKAQIYDIIRDFAAEGAAVLMVSSELEELEALCHRVLMLSDGAITGSLENGEITKERMLFHLLGESNAERSLV